MHKLIGCFLLFLSCNRVYNTKQQLGEDETIYSLIKEEVCDTVTTSHIQSSSTDDTKRCYIFMLHTKKHVGGKQDSLQIEGQIIKARVVNNILLNDTSIYNSVLVVYKETGSDSMICFPFMKGNLYCRRIK